MGNDIINKIKSPNWNSFLVKHNELEEYLTDGVIPPPGGLFFKYSKAVKEDNVRRNARFAMLIKQKIVNVSVGYIEHVKTSPDKATILRVTGKDKGIFGREASSLWTKPIGENDKSFIELIKKEKEECGDIVSFYPIKLKEGDDGVLFITTKGICTIGIKKDENYLTYATANSALPYGAIVTTVTAMTAHFVSGVMDKHSMNKQQKLIVDYSYKYSPCLVARCFEKKGQFLPYDIINILIYGREQKGINLVGMDCFLHNGDCRIMFFVEQDIMIEIIKKLSGDTPPRLDTKKNNPVETKQEDPGEEKWWQGWS